MKIPLLAVVLLRLKASSAAIESPNLSSSSTSLHRIRNADRVVKGAETPAGRVATIAGAPPGRRELSSKSSNTFASTDFGTDGLYFLSSMSLSASFSFAYVEPCSPLSPVTPDGEELLIRNMFADIGECAGVDMDAHGDNCAFEHMLDKIITGMMDDPTVVAEHVRRLVEGSASSCDKQPSEAEMNLMVSFLLEGAEDKCTANEVEQVTSDLTTILKMPRCLGTTPCNETTATATSSITTTIITNSTTAATSFTTTTSTTEEEEGRKLPPTTSTLVSTNSTPVVNEPANEATVTHESHQKVSGNSSDKRNMLPLISIAGGLVAVSTMVAGCYCKKNTKSGIIHPDDKSVQSIDSKSTNESLMSGSESSEDLESSKFFSLASMAAMSTLVANTSRADRRDLVIVGNTSRADRRVSI